MQFYQQCVYLFYKFIDLLIKKTKVMKRVFVAFNLSKGLWGKHLTESKALKIAQAVNGNDVLIKVIYGLHPKDILIDDLGTLSYRAESYPKIEEYEGELYKGELFK